MGEGLPQGPYTVSEEEEEGIEPILSALQGKRFNQSASMSHNYVRMGEEDKFLIPSSLRPFLHTTLSHFLSLSLHPHIHPSIHPSIHSSIHPSIHPSIDLS